MENGHEQAKNLISFCKKYKEIACYGAANYGHTVKHYLELHNIEVNCFLVSKKEYKIDTIDGIPVYDKDEFSPYITEYGIIISLTSMYHETIKEVLINQGLSANHFFFINYDIWKFLYDDLLNHKRNLQLLNTPYVSELNYLDKAQYLDETYSDIFIEYMDVGALGSYAGWIGCREREKVDIELRKFILYYPYTMFEQEKGNEFRGANGELLFRLCGTAVDIVSEKNIGFWRYYIQTHKNKIHFVNKTEPYKLAANSDYLTEYSNNQDSKIYVALSPTDIKMGAIGLAQMGLSSDYICISARDAVYLGTRKGMRSRSVFDKYRNSDIKTRVLAVKYLLTQKIQSVRMGKGEEVAFTCDGLIDYATKYYDEFMDIFLAKNCKFFVCDVSGISALGNLFSKPMLFTNAPLLTTRYDAALWLYPDRDIAILKKMWHVGEKRFLSLSEMLEFEVDVKTIDKPSRFVFLEYEKRNIIPIDNTPEEILAAVQEMNERIDGTIQYDDLDIELQKRYREIVDNYPMRDNVLNNWRLGAKFLRDNQWLLE